MTILTVGGIGFKNHYKTLADAIAHARTNDIIRLKTSVPVNTVEITKKLTIDGNNNGLFIQEGLKGLALHDSVTLQNIGLNLPPKSNAISIERDNLALTLENVTVSYLDKADPRDYYTPIYTNETTNLTLSNCKIPFAIMLLNQLTLSNSIIGDIHNTESMIDALSTTITNSTLSHISFITTDGLSITDSETFGFLKFKASVIQDKQSEPKVTINGLQFNFIEQTNKQYRKSFKDSALIKQNIVFLISEPHVSLNVSRVTEQPYETIPYTWYSFNITETTLSLNDCTFIQDNYLSIATNSKINCESGNQPQWQLNDSEVVDTQTTGNGESSAYQQLQDMIGLESVKEQLNHMLAVAKMNASRKARGLDSDTAFNMNMVFAGAPGVGKAEWVENHIFTPDGERRFGDLKPGDYVFDEYGKPTRIKNIYPRGFLDAYRLTTDQKRSGIYSADHLWTYTSSNGKRYQTKPLKHFINSGLRYPNRPDGHKGNHKFKLPTNTRVDYSEKEQLLHPYVMGAFIANGALTVKQLTLSTADDFIPNKIKTLCHFKKCVRQSDHNYNWMFYHHDEKPHIVQTIELQNPNNGKLSHEKFIPDEYLYGSYEQRLELLQGLMDNDGCIQLNENRYSCSYSTTSPLLARGVQILIESLGWNATIFKDKRTNKRTCYNIRIGIPNADKYLLFTLPRKLNIAYQAQIEESRRKYHKRYDLTSIINIENLHKKLPMMCIEVENPSGLYLSCDFIVTHNTMVSKLFGQILYEEHVLPKPTFKVTTRKDFVSKYIGETAQKTHALIESARGGVLFIDEAYSLMPHGDQDHAQEAVDQLVMDVNEMKGEILVILAGYTEPMRNFMDKANVGLNRRFPNWIEFPSYDCDDMLDILLLKINKGSADMTQDDFDYLEDKFIQLWNQDATDQGLDGNGGYIENLLRDLTAARDIRLSQTSNFDQLSDADLINITKADVDAVFATRLHS